MPALNECLALALLSALVLPPTLALACCVLVHLMVADVLTGSLPLALVQDVGLSLVLFPALALVVGLALVLSLVPALSLTLAPVLLVLAMFLAQALTPVVCPALVPALSVASVVLMVVLLDYAASSLVAGLAVWRHWLLMRFPQLL